MDISIEKNMPVRIEARLQDGMNWPDAKFISRLMCGKLVGNEAIGIVHELVRNKYECRAAVIADFASFQEATKAKVGMYGAKEKWAELVMISAVLFRSSGCTKTANRKKEELVKFAERYRKNYGQIEKLKEALRNTADSILDSTGKDTSQRIGDAVTEMLDVFDIGK